MNVYLVIIRYLGVSGMKQRNRMKNSCGMMAMPSKEDNEPPRTLCIPRKEPRAHIAK